MVNKRGISAIVATVLIILITVAAVTVIWAAVLPMVNDRLKSSQNCLDAESNIRLLDEGYTCRSSDGANVSVQVMHLAEVFDLADIQVLVSSGGDTATFEVSNDTTTIVPTGSNIPFPGENEKKVYIINTSTISGTLDEVQIAPVVAVGNTEKICGTSLSTSLRDC